MTYIASCINTSPYQVSIQAPRWTWITFCVMKMLLGVAHRNPIIASGLQNHFQKYIIQFPRLLFLFNPTLIHIYAEIKDMLIVQS